MDTNSIQGHKIKLNCSIDPQRLGKRERERADLSMQHLFDQSNNLIGNLKSIISLNTLVRMRHVIVRVRFQAVLAQLQRYSEWI